MDAAAASVVINQEHCLHYIQLATVSMPITLVCLYNLLFSRLSSISDVFFSSSVRLMWKIVISLKYCRHHDEFYSITTIQCHFSLNIQMGFINGEEKEVCYISYRIIRLNKRRDIVYIELKSDAYRSIVKFS